MKLGRLNISMDIVEKVLRYLPLFLYSIAVLIGTVNGSPYALFMVIGLVLILYFRLW